MLPMVRLILRRKAFTLLEILIAIVILTTGVIAVIWAFNAGMFAATDVENVDLALNLAQEKMETIKDTAYAGIANEAKAAVSGFPKFQRQVAVTAPLANMKQVVVTVYWNVKNGETSVALTTLAANY